MIPKTFHWVWLGDKPLPKMDKKLLVSWKKFHPGWQFSIWCEYPDRVKVSGFTSRPLPPLVNKKYYDDIETWVEEGGAITARSDIVRCEVIARHGGVYLDTDVECLDNIESLMENVRLFTCDEWGAVPACYMFGAVANHPALWTVVRHLEPHLTAHQEPLNAVFATGPFYINDQLRGHPDLVIFPYMLFNPLDKIYNANKVERWPECSLGNHYSDGKWWDQPEKQAPPAEFCQ
jgi:mannosyltransferase OCH1-like enzyme